MGRNTFNWWRRNKKRRTLKKTAPLLLRIENGDFELSQYWDEANLELDTKRRLTEFEEERGKRLGLKYESIRQNVFNATDQYQRRYNRLFKDFTEDEDRMLDDLRESLRKEFGKDMWDKCMERQRGKGRVIDIYNWYKKQSGMTTTPSELAIKLKRKTTKGL
jgi:hypothetical protein